MFLATARPPSVTLRIRAIARERGAVAVIPYRKYRKAIPTRFAPALYCGRDRIEQLIGKLKRFAMRCEKTARNFRSILAHAAGFVLPKSVHTTKAAAGRFVAGREFH